MEENSHLPVLYSKLLGQSVLDPMDTGLQKRVQGSFRVKLQRNEVADPESNYRLLAINILERAKELNYSAADMEKACRRFEITPMYGDRIEIASFFASEPEQLYPYSWAQRLHGEGKAVWAEFDGYEVVVGQPLKWRKHDGKKLEGMKLVVWQGVNVGGVNGCSSKKKDIRKCDDSHSQNLQGLQKQIVELCKELAEARLEIADLKGRVGKVNSGQI